MKNATRASLLLLFVLFMAACLTVAWRGVCSKPKVDLLPVPPLNCEAITEDQGVVVNTSQIECGQHPAGSVVHVGWAGDTTEPYPNVNYPVEVSGHPLIPIGGHSYRVGDCVAFNSKGQVISEAMPCSETPKRKARPKPLLGAVRY